MIYNKPSLILTKSEEAPSVAVGTPEAFRQRSWRRAPARAVAKGNVGELQFASEVSSERAVRFLMPGLSASVVYQKKSSHK